MSNVFIIAERIRDNARQIGYDARMSGAYIPNPYTIELPFHQHWNDGYDLGVRDANEDLVLEERSIREDFSD